MPPFAPQNILHLRSNIDHNLRRSNSATQRKPISQILVSVSHSHLSMAPETSRAQTKTMKAMFRLPLQTDAIALRKENNGFSLGANPRTKDEADFVASLIQLLPLTKLHLDLSAAAVRYCDFFREPLNGISIKHQLASLRLKGDSWNEKKYCSSLLNHIDLAKLEDLELVDCQDTLPFINHLLGDATISKADMRRLVVVDQHDASFGDAGTLLSFLGVLTCLVGCSSCKCTACLLSLASMYTWLAASPQRDDLIPAFSEPGYNNLFDATVALLRTLNGLKEIRIVVRDHERRKIPADTITCHAETLESLCVQYLGPAETNLPGQCQRYDRAELQELLQSLGRLENLTLDMD